MASSTQTASGSSDKEDLLEQLIELTEELEISARDHIYEKEEYEACIEAAERIGQEEEGKDALEEAGIVSLINDMNEAGIRAEGAEQILEEVKSEMQKLLDRIKREAESLLGSDEYKQAVELLKQIEEGTYKPADEDEEEDEDGAEDQ
ncbi:hypothetical protein I302_106538 [Kwoniella bestiolae CBS 10118]|uniref:Uncharacterized protein n=1 Tax=Kwoniella bestiolae CBS 10118 TaxID=1296100 RepID=A0A1B9G145_9TREE|nr:hypothetical protein I302_06203 [Kwoniella bestiolae CBS 10118]OCF24742.1 hypothetical protein I302_06203 [Kwoniella bestiolae CBS 10118]